MAKMKYSEIPRDLSSDSIAAYRLAQVIKFNTSNWIEFAECNHRNEFGLILGIPWSRQVEEELKWRPW